MAFSYKAVHLSENPCYTLSRSGLIESPYIQTTRTRFVQPGKIEIDANERAAIGKRNAAFSFALSSILSLTIYGVSGIGLHEDGTVGKRDLCRKRDLWGILLWQEGPLG
jgi:hypothetical protein